MRTPGVTVVRGGWDGASVTLISMCRVRIVRSAPGRGDGVGKPLPHQRPAPAQQGSCLATVSTGCGDSRLAARNSVRACWSSQRRRRSLITTFSSAARRMAKTYGLRPAARATSLRDGSGPGRRRTSSRSSIGTPAAPVSRGSMLARRAAADSAACAAGRAASSAEPVRHERGYVLSWCSRLKYAASRWAWRDRCALGNRG